MKKTLSTLLLFILLGAGLIFLCGAGSKAAGLSAIYASSSVLSLAIAVSYAFLIRKKSPWFVLLFSSVFVVNTGYLALSLSKTLSAALWANRISYLGSVFMPFSMLMLILDACNFTYKKRLPALLLGIGAAVFLIAASPGVLKIYYKEVSLAKIGGATVLEKVYGPWHSIYLMYLLAYFIATARVIILHACSGKNFVSVIHAAFMGAAVFVNIGVWLIEQFVRIDFELLSVSYIVSEMFLLLLCLLIQNAETQNESAPAQPPKSSELRTGHPHCASADRTIQEQCEHFAARRASLTPTEHAIYQFYLEGKSTKEIMEEMSIKENTLKYHNKNIYSKLGVSSRKQLIEIATLLNEAG
ncbi:MAG: hypothetical protein IIW08_06545 [Clostridia bacterium]|nr:hypothetical protein [Clostridia bacterium]